MAPVPPELFAAPIGEGPARRACGFSVSVVLHVAAVAGFALVAPPPGSSNPPQPGSQIAVVYVPSEPSAASRDRDLLEEAPLDAVVESAGVHFAGFEFDIAKIRERRDALFPFLTADLPFLDRMADDTRLAPSGLVNPYAQPARDAGRRPPLEIDGRDLQAIIDRSWSRRDRWRAFSEFAGLMATHDPDSGRLPDLIRAYVDQNLLQPFCDAGPTDPRFWAMLEIASEHTDFVDLVDRFVQQHPSSRATTELLFLLDELVQGNRHALRMLLQTDPDDDLPLTTAASRAGHELAVALRGHYRKRAVQRQLDSWEAISARYDGLRLRILTTIVDSTPDGYRSADARFLIGTIVFDPDDPSEALRWWGDIKPEAKDTYAWEYSRILDLIRSGPAVDAKRFTYVLEAMDSRSWLASIRRLRQFGHDCHTF